MIVHRSIYKFVETLLLFYEDIPKLEDLLEKTEEMNKILKKHKEFQEFLSDPSASIENKKDFINKMLQPVGFDTIVINTVSIIVDNHFSDFIKEFFKILVKELYVKLRIKHVFVSSTSELDKEQKRRMEESFKKRLNARKVIFDYKIDKSLLLGIRVKYDDIVEELSTQSQLKKVERQLKKYSRAINFI